MLLESVYQLQYIFNCDFVTILNLKEFQHQLVQQQKLYSIKLIKFI